MSDVTICTWHYDGMTGGGEYGYSNADEFVELQEYRKLEAENRDLKSQLQEKENKILELEGEKDETYQKLLKEEYNNYKEGCIKYDIPLHSFEDYVKDKEKSE